MGRHVKIKNVGNRPKKITISVTVVRQGAHSGLGAFMPKATIRLNVPKLTLENKSFSTHNLTEH